MRPEWKEILYSYLAFLEIKSDEANEASVAPVIVDESFNPEDGVATKLEKHEMLGINSDG